MSVLSSMSISRRLYAIVALLGVAFVAAAVVAGIRLEAVVAKAHATGELRVPQLRQMAELELNVTRVSLQLRHAMLARTPEELAATLADVEPSARSSRKPWRPTRKACSRRPAANASLLCRP